MQKPHIGITTSYQDGNQMLSLHYVRAIERAGGVPLIVPMLETAAAAQAFTNLLDGLIITGGPGIVDGLIGDLPDDLPKVDPVRDASDKRIYEAFKNRPMLGICYGMQFINAQHGGTIYADVAAQHPGAANHSPKRDAPPHNIRIYPQTHLHSVLAQDTLEVNTYHIQAIAQIGEALQVSATAPDGVIEAFETSDKRIMGVQFHPERMGDAMQALFDDFVARCHR